ncbi:MAG: threonine/serine exporter family protein [Brotaphodocola sp.]
MIMIIKTLATIETLIQLIMAYLGSMGFAILFHLRHQLMIFASMGGVLTWLMYLICGQVMDSVFLPSFMASTIGAFYAEILARILKTPSTPFFMVAMIPLIPGSTLYYTMEQAVHGYLSIAGIYGVRTMQCALGIGAGMSLAWAVCDLSRKIMR